MTKDIDLDALQSCPFCGADPLMQEHPPHTHSGPLKAIGIPDHPGSWTIECPTDGCCGMIADTREAVTATWNRRADTSTQTDTSKSADTERLDWLDDVNRRTNERYGTVYGWKFDINHNRAALTDHNLPAISVREAIDAAISARRATESGKEDENTQVKETAIPLTTADAKEREDHIEAERGMVGEQATCRVDYLRANFTPFYLLANARRIASAEYRRKPNWVLAMDLFAVGSNSAHAICREAGIDPDAYEVKPATPGGKE